MDNLIEIKNVEHSYANSKILHDLSFNIKVGEFVCLLGPSGCGKTTTLKIVLGLETPQKGSVLLNGEVIVENGKAILPPEKRGIGVVFQDFSLFPHLTVSQNVGFGLKSCSSDICRCEVDKALRSVDMLAFKDVYPSELSGGQQQRVSLARAIAPKPSLILLDEPFSHLDSRLKESMRDQTLHALKAFGSAGLMITHDPEEAMFMADKIIVMNSGNIIQVGSPSDLYLKPTTPFIAHFFGDVNTFYGVVDNEKVQISIGIVDAIGMPNGAKVSVVIRPEGIVFKDDTNKPDCTVKVLEVKMLGMTSLVHMDYKDLNGNEGHLHSRVYGQNLPCVGDVVNIGIKSENCFVFIVE